MYEHFHLIYIYVKIDVADSLVPLGEMKQP